MSYTGQIDTFAQRLKDDVDYKTKHSVLSELSDMIEAFTGPTEYEHYLSQFIPIYIELLNTVPISFSSLSPEHKLRNSILEVLHRSQMNETFQTYAIEINDTLQKLLSTENEENGVLCLKILTSLFKSYKAILSEKAESFIQLIMEMYKNTEQLMKDTFVNNQQITTSVNNAFTSPSPSSPSLPSNEEAKQLAKSMYSFKTIAECPITMVTLTSSYKQLVTTSLPDFIPHIIGILQLEVPQQKEARRLAEEKGSRLTSVTPAIKNRAAYGDFILGQVKAASFLAYIFIRGYSQTLLKNYTELIPDLILRILQDCPSELSAARKELLHATRHILTTPYRNLFIPKLDLLFDEKVLIGDGLTVHETLRPLAYSIVADFVHNVRNELSTDKILTTITMYCNHLQDSTLALTVQIMSAKLLLNLVERIMRLNSKSEGRQLFMLIIDAFTKRFKALNRQYGSIMKHHDELDRKRIAKEKKNQETFKQDHPNQFDADDEINKFLEKIKKFKHQDKDLKVKEILEETTTEKKDHDGDVGMVEDEEKDTTEKPQKTTKEFDIFDIQQEVPILVSPNSTSDPLKDARYLFRTLLQFLKTISYGLKNFNPQPPPAQNEAANQRWNDLARGFSNEEVSVLRELFRECISGMRFFSTYKQQTKPDKKTLEFTGPSLPVSASKEEKDLMENFAIIFIHIDPATFNEIVQAEISFLYDAMLRDSALLHIPQFFLANENTSPNFSGLLISFLKERLDQLGSTDIIKTNILIRLFKLCFMSVNLFPALNEKVILPHLNDLILKSLKLKTTSQEPIAYFHLIRTLFRSIGGGRFENLYKEIMPLLQVLLESLNRMISNARRPQERDIYVELCLTVPVRLSVLVPHLNYLMKPLVLALNSSQELVSQGLRTLELCVDNLTAEYFDPIIEPVIDDVMQALWKHLKPLPYHHQHSHTTFRILGKLGGRNRRFIKPHQDLRVKSNLHQDINASFKIEGLPEEKANLSISTGIEESVEILEDATADTHYRISAFKYLSRTFLLFISTSEVPSHYAASLANAVKLITQDTIEVDKLHIEDEKIISKHQLNREQQLALRLFKSIFYAISIPELKAEATELIVNITEHLALLGVGKVLAEKVKNQRPFLVHDKEGQVVISERIMFDAIIYALSSYFIEVREAGIQAIRVVYDTSVSVFGSKEKALEFPILRSFFNSFVHSSYDEAYYNKLASTLGLKTMVEELEIPITWFKPRQFEFIHAMFYVLRDTNPEAPHEVCDNAKKLILHVLVEANKGVPDAEVAEKPFQTIVGALVYDLSNANPVVRETSQEALKVLSENTKVPISSMIEKCKGILLTPIFGKPLRALPFPMQIGNIEAITFCLGLENSFLTFNDELNRLLMEALTLVDAEDESLTSSHKVSEHKTAEQLVKLRVVCIKLLSLALTKPEFTSSQQGHTRIRILAVFFKTLCAKSTEIINASHLGLQKVLSQNAKLPKELLQNGLRPMLMNLSDHKKLTVSGLEALARLLELLITYFKVEIGRKLLDHLMAWAQPAVLHSIASEELEHNPTVKIIVAILNIFHLLPPKAYTFMEELMKTLNYLEDNLRRKQGSPFRGPIAKFLNRFPNETLQFFSQQFQLRKMGSKMAYFVGLKECAELRGAIKENINIFYTSITTETQAENKSIKFANFIDLIKSLAESDSKWLVENKQILLDVSSLSKEITNIERSAPLTSPIHFCIRQGIENLQGLFVNLFERNPRDAGVTLGFIDLLSSLDIPISSALEDFVFEKIVRSDCVELRQDFLAKSIIFATENKSLKSKIFILKNIFNAILVSESLTSGNLDLLAAKVGSKIPAWLDLAHNRVWRANNELITNHTAGVIDNLRFELLQMSALLIKYAPEVTADLRKDVIKFSWNFIKLDDILTKQAAYVVTSYFISVYDTPIKIVTQVFVALLRMHSGDSRFLIRQSLDLLAPVMPQRMGPSGSSTGWIKWVRRVLSENNSAQNLTVYQFLIHHADIFYVARDHFIPNIITYMGKLTSMANPAMENQLLAIELAELILNWEIKAKEEAHVEQVGSSASPVAPSNLTEKEEEKLLGENAGSPEVAGSDITTPKSYAVPFVQREACVTFLIRFICVSSQRSSENELGQKALHILYKLLSPGFWSEVTVKLQFFEKFMVQADLSSPNLLGYCLNALDVLTIALEGKTSEWIVENIAFIQNLLDKCLHSDNHDVQEVLQRVLRIVMKAINNECGSDDKSQSEDVKTFLALLGTIVADDLQNTNSVAAGVTLAWTLANHYPKILDPLVQSIIRTFAKICKDHISISQTDTSTPQAEFESKMTTRLLEKILYISSMRISTLSDQRRIFLTLLAQLIDRSLDIRLLENIIDIVRSWVFSPADLFPTAKEKAAILIKMLVFELRGELTLSKEFYQIIVDIFEDKSMACTELTVRMEQPFLAGTRLADVDIRTRLMSILNESLERDVNKRLHYVIREQNWEFLADYRWLNQAIQLIYGAFDGDFKVKLDGSYQFAKFDQVNAIIGDQAEDLMDSDVAKPFIERQVKFLSQVDQIKAQDLLEPLTNLFYKSPEIVHKTWINLFPVAYSAISRREKQTFKESLVSLLSKDYHTRQADSRPNVIQSLLEGIGRCPDLQLPPHLIKYLGYSFDAWYPSIKILESIEEQPFVENTAVRETNQDALIEVYATLQEEDMFYGQWRRRAKYLETNAALSYEQIGLWDKALQLYEAAQIKARSGVLPYGESEYSLWEDNWILCAEKLQHWDILTELAKHEGFTDLLLECGWRVADWTADKEPLEQSVKTVMDVPTPRRQIFETFLCLQGYAQQKETLQDLSRLCDEGIQLALRKWHSLPSRSTNAHIPLLHTFQQYVEFMEASQVYGSLLTTNAQNLDNKSQELKRVLQAWRERLPNVWDDINIWNDLVTWRQHAFGVINKVYMPFIPALQQQNGNSNANSYAYRGYHEIAWVINRFAHVARKHNMPDVCISQLTKIYTLPNIEIQEAFLKLREQAKCHYQNPNELNTGLDVISNTNLVYFATQQKAEFFTLKGMFLAKLKAQDEANQAFATAVQIDLNLAKAWAEWGHFNDRRLRESPNEIVYANNAISCYLQAAGLYKNGKARALLCRILWLISLDDTSGSLSSAFESYRGEVPVWYWITFIPQLLTSLSHKEAKLVRQILIRIAKTYPQALHFQLRTTKEDFAVIQRQAMAVANRQNGQVQNQGQSAQSTPQEGHNQAPNSYQASPQVAQQSPPSQQPNVADSNSHSSSQSSNRQPWEYVEEIMGILKTAYPLLALSLESLVDQINHRFKSSADEDAYRLVVALLNDGIQYSNRLPNPREDAKLPSTTEANISRFADTILPKHIRAEFDKDFISCKPNLESYIIKLRKWRDRLEDKLDRRFSSVNLESVCPHLSEFHHQKFEEIEVPGQYLLNKDNNTHFVKIERFLPTLELVRGTHACYKRIKIRGHDGSLHQFAVQFPAARHCRREERIFQLYRILNDTLSRKVQTRRRNIQLTLPIAVPLSPHIRIMNDNTSVTSLQEIYEGYCKTNNVNRDEPLLYYNEKLRAAFDPHLPKPDIISIRVEILSSIQSLIVPNNVVKNYFAGLYPEFEDFWLFRKQFTSQYASFIFMTYMMSINSRQPHKISINERSGAVTTFEMLPSKIASSKANTNFFANTGLDVSAQRAAPIFYNPESVPFRLTPNIQQLIGEAGLEGILSVHILCIAKALTEPESELNTYLPLFVRDETISWFTQQHRPSAEEPHLRDIVRVNVDLIAKKVQQLCIANSSTAVTTQHILDFIQQAVNPKNLAASDPLWMPYL